MLLGVHEGGRGGGGHELHVLGRWGRGLVVGRGPLCSGGVEQREPGELVDQKDLLVLSMRRCCCVRMSRLRLTREQRLLRDHLRLLLREQCGVFPRERGAGRRHEVLRNLRDRGVGRRGQGRVGARGRRHVRRREVQHTGAEQGCGRRGLRGGHRRRDSPRQHQVHVFAAALKHLDVPLFLAEHHVAVVALLRCHERRMLCVHLDERLATWLTL